MPIQVTHSDVNSAPQKLSKIETLRLARNYIIAMTQTLQEGKPMEMTRFTKILSRELSQTTENLLSGALLKRSSNFPYTSFHHNDFEMTSYENSNLDFNSYKPQYLVYGENYNPLWNYNNESIVQDNLSSCNLSKNFNISPYWEYNNNVIASQYSYGSYQYVTWQ